MAGKKKTGRPTKYTKAIADEICQRLSTGETLRRICRDDYLPDESTVRQWAVKDYNGFYTQYARSRDIGLDSMADEILDIADDGSNDFIKTKSGEKFNKEAVFRSNLRVDARKWYLSKLAPKRYDKPQPEPQDDEDLQEEYTLPVDEDAPDDAIL